MIQNILFDMGGVLIRWDPVLFSSRLGLPEEDRSMLVREVYGELEWVELDQGSLTEAEAIAAICRRVPARLHDAVERLVLRWPEPEAVPPGMYELVEDLSAAGYGLYLLTNAGPGHSRYWSGFPVSRFFGDRLFVSSQWNLLKPDTAFFEIALDHFALDRDACVYIDDIPLNVLAALDLGIDAFVFHDAASTRRKLRELDVRI